MADESEQAPAQLGGTPPPEWDQVKDTFQKAFPDLDPKENQQWYETQRAETVKQRKLSHATDFYKQHADEFFGPGSSLYGGERVPVYGAVQGVDYYKRLHGAVSAIEGGDANDDAYYVAGQHLAKQQYEASRSTGQTAFDAATQVPGMIAEFAMTGGAGGAARVAGEEAVGRLAGKYLGGRATAAIGKAAGFGTQGAALSAMMPSTYGHMAAQSVDQNEQGQLETRNTAGAISRGAVSSIIDNAIIPGVAGAYEKAATGSYPIRVLKKTLMALAGVETSGDIKGLLHLSPEGGPVWTLGQAALSGDPAKMEHALKGATAAVVQMGLLESITQAGKAGHSVDKAADNLTRQLIEVKSYEAQAPQPGQEAMPEAPAASPAAPAPQAAPESAPAPVAAASPPEPQTARQKSDALEAQHLEALKGLQDAQRKERFVQKEFSAGMTGKAQFESAQRARRGAEKQLKTLQGQLDEARVAAASEDAAKAPKPVEEPTKPTFPPPERRADNRPPQGVWENIKAENPDWSVEQIGREAARQAEGLKLDNLTGFQRGDVGTDREDATKQAIEHITQTGGPAVHAEIDLANLGGLNGRFGHQGANVHYRAFADILKEELGKLPGEVKLFRHGGDEMSANVVGVDQAAVEAALTRARARIAEYATKNGMDDIAHPKSKPEAPRSAGVGIHFGTTDVRPGDKPADVYSRADTLLETRKVATDVQRHAVEAAGPVSPQGQAAGPPGGAQGTPPAAEGNPSASDRAQVMYEQQRRSGKSEQAAITWTRNSFPSLGEWTPAGATKASETPTPAAPEPIAGKKPEPPTAPAQRMTATDLHGKLMHEEPIPGLTKRQQHDLKLHIVDGLPLEEVGKLRGVTKQAIQASTDKALQALHGMIEEPPEATVGERSAQRLAPGDLPNEWVEHPTTENLSDALNDYIVERANGPHQFTDAEAQRIADLQDRLDSAQPRSARARKTVAEAVAFLKSVQTAERGTGEPAPVRPAGDSSVPGSGAAGESAAAVEGDNGRTSARVEGAAAPGGGQAAGDVVSPEKQRLAGLLARYEKARQEAQEELQKSFPSGKRPPGKIGQGFDDRVNQVHEAEQNIAQVKERLAALEPDNDVASHWDPIPPSILKLLNDSVASGDRVMVEDLKEILDRNFSDDDVKAAWAAKGKFPKGTEGQTKKSTARGLPAQMEGGLRKHELEQHVLEAIHEQARQKAVQAGFAPAAVEESSRLGDETGGAQGEETPDASFDFGHNAPGMGAASAGRAGESLPPPGTPGVAAPGGEPAEPLKSSGWFQRAKDWLKSFGQQQFPALTRLSASSGEKLAAAANAKAAAKSSWDYFSHILKVGNKPLADMTPEETRAVGAVWLERRLREYRDNLNSQGLDSSKVGTLVGQEGSPLQTEADYQAGREGMGSFWEAVRQEWTPEVEKNYRGLLGLEPEDEINSPSQIPTIPLNAIAIRDGSQGPGVVGTGRVQGFENLRVRKPGFTRAAELSAPAYDVDLAHMMQRTLNVGIPAARRAEFVRTAIDEGVIKKLAGGEKPPEGWQYLGLDPAHGLPGLEPNAKYYVHPDAFRDVVQGLGIGERPGQTIAGGIRPITDLLNKVALVSPVELATHIANHVTASFRPGMGVPLLNIVTDTIPNAFKIWRGDPELLRRVMELAKINASFGHEAKPGLLGERLARYDPTAYVNKFTSGLIDVMQKGMRVQLEDAFNGLAAKKLVPDTPTAKTNFINQALGNYNAQAGNRLAQFLKDSGLQPFATAAHTFTVQGIKTAYGGAINAPATSPQASLQLHATAILKLLPALAVGPALNLILHGNAFPQGVPAFAIQTRKEDDGKVHYFDPLAFTGLRRGWKATGANAPIEAAVQGKDFGKKETWKDIGGQAGREFWWSGEHLLAGPPAQFIGTAKEKGVVEAARGINPLVKTFTEPDKKGKKPSTLLENVMQSAGPFGERTKQAAHGKRR